MTFLRHAALSALLLWATTGISLALAQAEHPTYVPAHDGWVELRSAAMGMSLQTPARMTLHVDTLQTPIGTVLHHTFFLQPKDEAPDNHLYLFHYCVYPPETAHSDSTALLEEFFEATIAGATEAVKGELAYASPVELDGYPGRLWRIHYRRGQATIKTRAFMVGHTYYALSVVSTTDRNLNSAGERFLGSFRLGG